MIDMMRFLRETVPELPKNKLLSQSISSPTEYAAYLEMLDWVKSTNIESELYQTHVVLLSLTEIPNPDFIAYRSNGNSGKEDRKSPRPGKLMTIRLPENNIEVDELRGRRLTIYGDPSQAELMDVQLEQLGSNEDLEVKRNAAEIMWGKSYPIELAIFDRTQIPTLIETPHFLGPYQLVCFPIAIFLGKGVDFWCEQFTLSRDDHVLACIPSFGPPAELPFPTLDMTRALTWEESEELSQKIEVSDSVEDTWTTCGVVYNRKSRKLRIETSTS